MSNAKSDTARSLLQIPAFVVAWLILQYLFAGLLALAYVALFTGGFILWWFTARKATIDPQRIIVGMM